MPALQPVTTRTGAMAGAPHLFIAVDASQGRQLQDVTQQSSSGIPPVPLQRVQDSPEWGVWSNWCNQAMIWVTC